MLVNFQPIQPMCPLNVLTTSTVPLESVRFLRHLRCAVKAPMHKTHKHPRYKGPGTIHICVSSMGFPVSTIELMLDCLICMHPLIKCQRSDGFLPCPAAQSRITQHPWTQDSNKQGWAIDSRFCFEHHSVKG